MNKKKRPPSKADRSAFRLLIYPKFQLGLMGIQIIVQVIVFGGALFFLNRAFQEFIDLGKKLDLTPDHPYFRILSLEATKLTLALGGSFVVGALISGLAALIMSHRLVGPIYRTRCYFDKIAASGKVSGQLKFRDGDFYQDLPTSVNQALEGLQKKTPSSNENQTTGGSHR